MKEQVNNEDFISNLDPETKPKFSSMTLALILSTNSVDWSLKAVFANSK